MSLQDVVDAMPGSASTPPQQPATDSKLMALVNKPGFFKGDSSQVAQWVKDAQEPTGFEQFAVPVGAAISDTARSLGHLFNLGAAATTPGAMPAAMAANAADQAKTDAQEQPARDYAADAHPSSYYGLYAPAMLLSQAPFGEGVGGGAAKLTDGLSASSKLLPRAAGFLARSSATGAGYGAQMPGDTMNNIATGAALGPLGEGAFNAVRLGARFGGKAFNGASDLVQQMANPDVEAQNTVRKIVQESATGTPTLTPSPIPGVNLSAGGQSMNPGLQSLERVVRSRNVGGQQTEALAQTLQQQNNSVIRGRFGNIASIDTPLNESSTAAHTALTDAQTARAAQESDLWDAVPLNTKVDAAKTSAAIDGYINGQSVTNQRIIQRTAGDFLDDFKAAVAKYAKEGDEGTDVSMPFQEVKDLRSTLGQSIRDAQQAGNNNAVRLLKGMDDRLLKTLGDENAFLGNSGDVSYRGNHTAPSKEFGAPMWDVTRDMYPDDFYSPQGSRIYGEGSPILDKQSHNIISSVKGNPDAPVTMYRAVPKNSTDSINPGDWVTINKNYAVRHGESVLDGNYDILSKKVKANDLWTNADSMHEFGYQPEGNVTAKQLGDSYNAARKFTADTHGTYFTKDVQGFLDKDPAKMLDTVTSTPDNLKAYLNAAGQAPDGGAKAVSALRDYLMSKGVGAASMSARGGTDKFINGQKLGDWLAANRTTLSQVFSGDELAQMDQLAKTSYRNIATEAATPRVGSNTLEKFMGNQNLPGVPGKLGAAANSIRDMLVGQYRGKTEKLLRDTLFDPQNQGLQDMLDQPMTQQNMNKLVTYMKTVPKLRDKVPLLFGAAMRAPQIAATRYLTYSPYQQAP